MRRKETSIVVKTCIICLQSPKHVPVCITRSQRKELMANILKLSHYYFLSALAILVHVEESTGSMHGLEIHNDTISLASGNYIEAHNNSTYLTLTKQLVTVRGMPQKMYGSQIQIPLLLMISPKHTIHCQICIVAQNTSVFKTSSQPKVYKSYKHQNRGLFNVNRVQAQQNSTKSVLYQTYYHQQSMTP